MHRSLIPFILASFGYILLLQADGMLLFEWRVRETVVDSQSTTKIYSLPSYWKTPFGKSLDDRTVRSVRTSIDDPCLDFKYVIKRSQNGEALERLSLGIYHSISWLFEWGWIGIVLSVIYMWWFLFWYKQGTSNIVLFTGIVLFTCILLSQVVRIVAPNIAYTFKAVAPQDCQGAVTFDAALVKLHYEMPIVLLAGICLELGTFFVMFRQIRKSVIKRQESSSPPVG